MIHARLVMNTFHKIFLVDFFMYICIFDYITLQSYFEFLSYLFAERLFGSDSHV